TAPNNLYLARDGGYVLVAANNDAVFRRMAIAMEREDLLDDPRYGTIRDRNTNHEALDAEVAKWAATLDAREAAERMETAGVPTSLVNTIADIFADAHFRQRDMLLDIPHEKLGSVTVAGVV